MSIGNKLTSYSKSNVYPFHMPGHKRRMYPCEELKNLYEMDITEIDGFDNLHDAQGIIKDAQERAAKVFGANRTYFLVNGTTSGILAAICGLVREGDDVVMARNCHKCVYNGVMLSGARPHYIIPEQEAYLEINAGITPAQVEEAISEIEAAGSTNSVETAGDTESAKDTTVTNRQILVVITSPTYEGIVSDILGIAKVCHEHNALLLVDAAHGAHLGFVDDFPQSAISCGADIVVTSIHKTLPAPTGTSLLHIAEGVKGANRIEEMLHVLETSSPSYPLMAGIDACVELLDKQVDSLFKDYTNRLNDFYNKADSLEALSVFTKDKLVREGSIDFDYGKIVVYDKTGRLSGSRIYKTLLDTYDIQPEMAAGGYCLLMTSIADDNRGFDRLTKALFEIDASLIEGSELPEKRSIVGRIYDHIIGKRIRRILFNDDNYIDRYAAKSSGVGVEVDMFNAGLMSDSPKVAMSAKKAMWEEIESIPVELSEGRISAKSIVFYPPGIPIAVSGEILTGEVVDTIIEGRNKGLTINGLNKMGEIEVLWEQSST